MLALPCKAAAWSQEKPTEARCRSGKWAASRRLPRSRRGRDRCSTSGAGARELLDKASELFVIVHKVLKDEEGGKDGVERSVHSAVNCSMEGQRAGG